MKYSFFFFLFFVFSFLGHQNSFAHQWQFLERGDETAKELSKQWESHKSTAPRHPFYQGIPHESTSTGDQLEQNSHVLSKKDEVIQFIKTSSENRPLFKIDARQDPFMVESEKILKNPMEIIGDKSTRIQVVQNTGKNETHSCYESGIETTHSCVSNLRVSLKEALGKVQEKNLMLDGAWMVSTYGNLSAFWPKGKKLTKNEFVHEMKKNIVSHFTKIPAKNILSVKGYGSSEVVQVNAEMSTTKEWGYKYTFRPTIKVPVFSWDNKCGHLEDKADLGRCAYVSKICSQSPETRTIDGVQVTQPCWQETYTYSCTYLSKDDCGPLRARGCIQVESKCKQWIGKTCVLYNQTYQCKGTSHNRINITGEQTPFCLDGNCRDQSWESNDEMMSSLAQLNLLKEMQGQFSNGLIFKGEDRRCSKTIVNFKDCCGHDKGWGNDLGLASCSADERALSQKRQKGLCHFVGTYCAKKVLGKCVKKKSSYCCFTNKLLKAFHLQGRPQIGLGWGEPKHPLCRGFTIEEIQRIDFSKLDLREVFEDLMQNYKENKANLKDMGKTINDRMKTIQKSIGPGTVKNVRQRDGA